MGGLSGRLAAVKTRPSDDELMLLASVYGRAIAALRPSIFENHDETSARVDHELKGWRVQNGYFFDGSARL